MEFVMDKDFNFYFMEMNTRLQVEMPNIFLMMLNILCRWSILSLR